MKETHVNFIFIFIAAILFIFAVYIYASYRDLNMRLYSWMGICTNNSVLEYVRNHSYTPSQWVKFNLPDGLWLFSFLLFMEAIWSEEKRYKWIFCITIISFAFGLEVLQYYGLFPGTGDIVDVLFYLAAIMLYSLIIKLKQMYYEKNT